MTNLTVDLCGLKLRNPLMLASGILGVSGDLLKRVALCGAGAVVTKSIGVEARRGYNPPVIDEVAPGTLINAMGLPNPGVKEFGHEIEVAKEAKVPVIANIFGFNKAEFVTVAEETEKAGVDMIEINLSCPHHMNKEAFSLEFIGQNPGKTREIVKAVKKAVSIPVMAKLTPNVSSMAKIANAAVEGGADAISAINTIRSLHIDIKRGTPTLSNIVGGMSGWPLKPIAVRCVAEIALSFRTKNLDVPIVGVGGMWNGEDVIEMLMAGAKCVQIGTAIMYRGLGIFGEIAKEIEDFMIENSYEDVNEFTGLALEKIRELKKWYTLL